LRVVHAHDQCGIAVNLCSIGAQKREFWLRVPRLPEYGSFPPLLTKSFGVGAELLARGLAALVGANLHIHGGHLSAFCLRTQIPYILHLHGSEIRQFSTGGAPFFSATKETEKAIGKAKAVIYSTPDLASFIKPIRGDATWLPIALDNTHVGTLSKQVDFADLFFPHVWTSAKGVGRLVDLVKSLQLSQKKPLKMVGIALGDHQETARQLGFQLVPPTSRIGHIQRMLDSRVVIGQGSGVPGATDLEAILHGANYVSFPMERNSLEHYGLDSKSQQTSSMNELLSLVRSALNNEFAQPATHRKILLAHSDENIYGVLQGLYDSL